MYLVFRGGAPLPGKIQPLANSPPDNSAPRTGPFFSPGVSGKTIYQRPPGQKWGEVRGVEFWGRTSNKSFPKLTILMVEYKPGRSSV
jgi:hypothetical protein